MKCGVYGGVRDEENLRGRRGDVDGSLDRGVRILGAYGHLCVAGSTLLTRGKREWRGHLYMRGSIVGSFPPRKRRVFVHGFNVGSSGFGVKELWKLD